jgi:hypothetical protein
MLQASKSTEIIYFAEDFRRLAQLLLVWFPKKNHLDKQYKHNANADTTWQGCQNTDQFQFQDGRGPGKVCSTVRNDVVWLHNWQSSSQNIDRQSLHKIFTKSECNQMCQNSHNITESQMATQCLGSGLDVASEFAKYAQVRTWHHVASMLDSKGWYFPSRS